jgi:hypothetical protein
MKRVRIAAVTIRVLFLVDVIIYLCMTGEKIVYQIIQQIKREGTAGG